MPGIYIRYYEQNHMSYTVKNVKLGDEELEWVSEWFSLTAFLRTADIDVHKVHTSRLVIAYTLKSLSSLT